MKRVTIAVLLVAFLAGCSKTLTRGRAKDLIWEKHRYGEAIHYQIDSPQEEIEEGVRRGFWKHGLTDYGKQFFYVDFDCHCLATLQKVTPRMEITGITGEGPSRTVLYDLYWFDDLPNEVRELFKNHEPDHHSSKLQLYDDGWRVVY